MRVPEPLCAVSHNRSVVRSIFPALLLSAIVHAQLPEPSPAVHKVLSALNALNQSSTTRQKVRFEFSEAEVNEYLRYARIANPRPGLHSLSVKLFPANYISSFVVLDFDAVERWRPGTVPSLLRPALTGRKRLWIDVRLTAAKGTGKFSIEKAYFEKIPLPTVLVEKLIEIVAAQQKEEIDTTESFPLPMGIQTITISAQQVRGEN